MDDFRCETTGEPVDPQLLILALFGVTPDELSRRIALGKKIE